MTYKLDMLYSALFVPLGFKWKYRQQEIDVAPDILQATRPPRPELWANVINDFQPIAMERMGQA
jgi:hypothetical protein